MLSQSSIEYLWALINVNQLIAFMPLMDIKFPPSALILFKIIAFVNGDILVL